MHGLGQGWLSVYLCVTKPGTHQHQKGERAGASLYLHRAPVSFRTVFHWLGAWVRALAVGGKAKLAVVCLARRPSTTSFSPLATLFGAALPADQAGIPRPTPGNWSVLSRPVGCTGNLGAQWETRNLALYTLIWFLPVDYPTLYCKRRLVWWIMERIYPSKPWERGRGGCPAPARPHPLRPTWQHL